MISSQDQNQKNEFLEKLLSMSEDLKEYDRDDKQELMLMYVQDRLDKSTDEYLRHPSICHEVMGLDAMNSVF